MKKIGIIFVVIVIGIILSGNGILNSSLNEIDAKIYYVDHSMLRLIPVSFELGKTTKEKACRQVISELIKGQDFNRKILRVIPNLKDCIEVSVKNETAYVNLKDSCIKNLSNNKNHELLFIYSIVNSLTSVSGVDKVKFLFDGEEKKIEMGGIDMREVFIPDYYI